MNNFLNYHLDKLKKNSSNPELDLRILLNNSAVKKKEIILSNFNIKDINLSNFYKFFERRINHEPISKIFNIKNFWKYDFFVNENVLDPRPETELIIEKVLEYYPNRNKIINILDICTGSGCLAISLAKEFPNSNLVATDISLKALKIAKINATKMNCANKIQFVHCNLINEIKYFDIVVCNPPYISFSEYKKISKEIQLYEPKKALIASDEGYEYYIKIANFLHKILYNNSKVFIEIGPFQAQKAVNIFKKKKISCLKIAKDLQKLDRILILNKT